jgi:hypothetical protein
MFGSCGTYILSNTVGAWVEKDLHLMVLNKGLAANLCKAIFPLKKRKYRQGPDTSTRST